MPISIASSDHPAVRRALGIAHLDLLFITAGLVFLFLGGEALVRGASMLAYRMGLPPLLIGLTVVGFGTSAPELLVSVQAALEGSPDLAIGNVLGSNIANLLLIGGMAAFLSPFVAKGQFPVRDVLVMLGAAIVVLGLSYWGTIERLTAVLMLAALLAYLVITYRASRREISQSATTNNPFDPPKRGFRGALSVFLALVFVTVGIAALMQGANLLVFGATSIAQRWGISEAIIGLTIVAVGTSLPELVTTLVAALRRQSAIAVGNIIGSNIFNVFAILATTALVQPLTIPPSMARLDAPLLLGISALAAIMLLVMPKVGRITGSLALAGYAAYIGFLFL